MKRYITISAALLLSVSMPSFAQETEADTTAVAAEVATTTTIPDGDPDRLWEEANAAYGAGDYAAAADLYRAILDKDLHSAALYYNLANALFKKGELGRAILYYNRALRLAPSDEDIRHNLEYAERMTKDNIESVPEFFLNSWLRTLRGSLSCTAWTVLSLAMFAAMLALGSVYLLSQRIAARKAGFYGMLAALTLFVATSLFAWSERRAILDRNEAVVMGSAVSVKSSPDRSATDLFLLHEGTEVEITDRLADWCEIVIGDGKKGWIESRKIEVI